MSIAAAGPFGLGPLELVIILLVLVMLFGATRLKDLGGSLGQGIKEFRTAVKEEPEEEAAVAPVQSAVGEEAVIVAAVKCPSCGALNAQSAKHCDQCGTSIAAPVS